MIFYFSATGNSQWAAQEIAHTLSDRLFSIAALMYDTDQKNEFELKEDESIGFVFPVHSWGPPAIVIEFMKTLQLRHYDSHYLYMVCTCGDETGYTPQIVFDQTKSKGWKWDAAWSLVMPNNYILIPGFDADSKEVERQKLTESAKRIKEIIRKIGSQKKKQFDYHIGKFPLLKSRLIYPLFRKFAINAKPFFANDQCNGCKKCEKICPTHNIKVGEKPQWGDRCTSCTACFHICPQQAVQYGKTTRKKHQYWNPNIKSV